MRDYSGLLLQFGNFANLVNSQGRTPTEADVDFFVDQFLTTEYGFMYPAKSGAWIYSAKFVDKETGEPTLASKSASYSELEEEIKPLLIAKVEQVYSKLGMDEEAFAWDPTPISIDQLSKQYAMAMKVSESEWATMSGTDKRAHPATIKAVAYLSRVKSRIRQYNDLVIPFILRKTMHHPLAAGLYSTTSGKGQVIRRDEDNKPFVIESEKDLQKYLSSATVDGFPGAQDEQLRYIWFQPSPTGKDIKVAIIDLDNPAGLPDKVVRKGVRYIAKKLEDNGHPNLIMFTGNSYQVWFSRNEYQPLGDIQDARTLVASLMYNDELFSIGDGKARVKAINNKTLWIDNTVFAAGKSNRMFFNLHYPSEKSQKEFSGLVAVPISMGDIEKFDKLSNAHPDEVYKHFDRYASVVAAFFDLARIGQDYEVEAPPPCIRHQTKDPEHPLLSHLLENTEVINVPAENIEGMLEDETQVTCYIKERGVSAVLHYNATGSIRIDGTTLSTKVIQKSRGASVKVVKVKAVLITSNGTAIYDDYICRDIERYCEAKNITKLTLVGSVVKRDIIGNNRGAQAVRSILERKDGVDPYEARQLNFTPYKLVTFNKSVSNLPLVKQLEELEKIRTTRITPTPYFALEDNITGNVKRLFRDLLVQRKVGSLVVVGEETYLVTSRRTIKAVIMGLDKNSKAYQNDTPSIAPVFVAVTKKHPKFGPIYITIGKAQVVLSKEDRINLKEMVRGEEGEYENREGDIIKTFANVIPLNERVDIFAEDIEIVEPKIVVEVQYDDISPAQTAALPHSFRNTRSGKKFRAVDKKLWATGLIGAQVVAITGLSPTRTGDIGIEQDPLLASTGKAPSGGLSILDTLPNPRREYVRRNGAFFGVPSSRRIYIDGVYDEHHYDKKTRSWTGGVIGGKQAQVDLVSTRAGLPGELQRAVERSKKGEPGYQAFVDQSAKTKAGSAGEYYTITGLGPMYQDAVDDVYGVGGPFGSSTITMDGALEFGTTQMPYGAQLQDVRSTNKKQKLEDLKILRSQIGKIPTSRDPGLRGGDYDDQLTFGYSKADMGYIEAHKQLENELKSALTANAITEKQFKDLLEANNIMSNPVVKSDDWQSRVSEYAAQFEKWKDSPDPKESWENISKGMFGSWELPILEKERMLREATLQYTPSSDEVNAVNSRFGTPMSGELLESVLSDLYEEEEADDDNTQETDRE